MSGFFDVFGAPKGEETEMPPAGKSSAELQQEKVDASKLAAHKENVIHVQHGHHASDDLWKAAADSKEGHGATVPAAFKRTNSGEHLWHEMHAALDAQQLRTFQRWWNSWLCECVLPLQAQSLCEDIKPGELPIKLLEALTNTTAGKYHKDPKSRFEMIENHNIFLAELKAKDIKLVNIGAEDLSEGSQKLVLGLTWTLVSGPRLWGWAS